MRTRIRNQAVAVGLLLGALVGGCIDTALGLVLTVEGGAATADATTVTIEVRAELRVGEHALGGDSFIVPRASLFSGGEPVVDVNLERPAEFRGRLEPGESVTVTFRGTTDLPPASRTRLCGSDSATVILGWQAEEQPDDPLDPPIMSFGNGEGTVSVSGC